ncbi:MAG: hypothetical protein KJ571_17800 [Bacteroidetes bacterium]|nr:hypothetical protein [Bacteroidota bacterium]
MPENILNRSTIIEFIKNRFTDVSADGLKINSVTGFDKEYGVIKEAVGIRILFENTIVKLIGKDTLEFLHRVSTNDLKNLESLKVQNTLFTNEKGRLIDRTSLVNLNEFYLLLGGKNTQSLLSRWIDKYIIMEDIKISNGQNEFLVLEIMGPQTESYLTQICGKCIDELSENTVRNFEMEDSSAMIFKYSGIDLPAKYYMILKIEDAQKVINYLLNQNNIFDVNLIGELAYNHYRIEMGWPESPNEINDNFNPYESDLIKEVNFKKGCYIGQEVIARLDTYDKVQKKLCGVILNETISSEDTLTITDEENNEVGYLTSYSPNSHLTIGLAIIRKAYAEPNRKLSALLDNKQIELIVKELPIKK